jgi:hypothetical protein
MIAGMRSHPFWSPYRITVVGADSIGILGLALNRVMLTPQDARARPSSLPIAPIMWRTPSLPSCSRTHAVVDGDYRLGPREEGLADIPNQRNRADLYTALLEPVRSRFSGLLLC